MTISRKKFDYFRKDERDATKEYKEHADKVKSEVAKKMFLEMSKDEAKHVKMLDDIEKLEKKTDKKGIIKKIMGDKEEEEVDEDYRERVKDYLREVELPFEVDGMEEYEE